MRIVVKSTRPFASIIIHHLIFQLWIRSPNAIWALIRASKDGSTDPVDTWPHIRRKRSNEVTKYSQNNNGKDQTALE